MKSAGLFELPQQFFLFPRDLSWNLHVNLDDLITPSVTAHMGNAFAFEAEQMTVLRSLRNFDFLGIFERRDLDGCAECGLHEGDGNAAENIVLIADEEIMLFHLQKDIKVAVGA